jgi:hypothetical protein
MAMLVVKKPMNDLTLGQTGFMATCLFSELQGGVQSDIEWE